MREQPGGADVDHVPAKARKGVRAGRPGVHGSRHPFGHAVGIGLDAKMTDAPEDVDVQVNHPWGDDAAAAIDH